MKHRKKIEEEKDPATLYKEELFTKLTEEEFEQFKSIMQDYRATSDFEILLEKLIKLFGLDNNYKLLLDFSCLLKGKKKDQYIERVNELKPAPPKEKNLLLHPLTELLP